MRVLILIGGAALALAACGKGSQVDNTANVDASLTAENIVSNDVTAIDAVTGSDANMAADLNYVPGVTNSSASSTSGGSKPAPGKSGGTPAPVTSQPAPATQNAAANAAAPTNATN